MSSDDLIFLLKVEEKDKNVIKSSYITNDHVCSTVRWKGDVKTRNLHFTTLFENVYQYEIW